MSTCATILTEPPEPQLGVDLAVLAWPTSARRPLQIDDGASKTFRILAGHTLHRICSRGELVSTKRRRHEHDARVLDARSDEFSSELREIPNIARHDGAVYTRGVLKLASIVELRIADFMSADSVESTGTKSLGDARGQILVEVERHSAVTTRTSPGYR